jgi:dual specificity phosphatase 12
MAPECNMPPKWGSLEQKMSYGGPRVVSKIGRKKKDYSDMSGEGVLPACSSVLVYALDPGSKRVVCLLWRDAKATKHQSAQFFGGVVCSRDKEDSSEVDAVAREFSSKTGGVFAPRLKDVRKAAAESKSARVQRAQRGLYKRIKMVGDMPRGHMLFKPANVWLFVVPVMHHAQAEVGAACGAAGQAVWVDLEQLLLSLTDSAVRSVDLTAPSPLPVSPSSVLEEGKCGEGYTLPLYLGFTAVLRCRAHMRAIYDTLGKHMSPDLRSRIDEFSLEDMIEGKSSGGAEGAPRGQRVGGGDKGVEQPNNTPSEGQDASADSKHAIGKTEDGGYYACRKCRSKICSETDIVSHEPVTTLNMTFYYKNRNSGGRPAQDPESLDRCSSLFVDSAVLQQFVEQSGATETAGDVTCLGCGAHVGKYKWSGSQCSCGAWQTPSMQVLKCKVDLKGSQVVRKTQAPELAHKSLAKRVLVIKPTTIPLLK